VELFEWVIFIALDVILNLIGKLGLMGFVSLVGRNKANQQL
tara:strand:+ start:312 stop:434 length:123 start_codon:yes stop_codon:yes gene_type:complete